MLDSSAVVAVKVTFTMQYWRMETPLLSQWGPVLPNGYLADVVRQPRKKSMGTGHGGEKT